MKKAVFVAIMALSSPGQAAYLAGQIPSMIFGASTVKFGVDSPPSDTCDYHQRQFRFDATTVEGRNILSILLAAKMAGKQINIWYNPSTNAGTDKDTGCTESHLAEVKEIGID